MFATPTLLTKRLRLRSFRQSDLDAYAAMCADAEVMRHIGSGGPVERDMAWRQLALFAGAWALQGYGTWAIEERASGTLVGRTGFIHPEGWPGCEVGWLLARAHWGKGYAFEATAAAIGHGRVALGIGSSISLIRPGNDRSVALAERLGARSAGELDFLGGPTLLYRHPDAA
ncbi:MAG: GNAT family N-acetyltransferase [Proteobacteria bacterium]|nr:GNAT family N-acetyltransferase [Pseudomonadota bacterium]